MKERKAEIASMATGVKVPKPLRDGWRDRSPALAQPRLCLETTGTCRG